ncbi:MAG: hypothetical protein DRR16_29655 [Candidatus Parabeggiatoa sp. nov. 3]|nr:MAG: hypothetical protein DRR00_18815 [Gammaproteobacteria bacterium]RKZ56405.1 MAG: hypothetical protein DRQ99_28570 [Gammaproteobacteria bacterium]RKZ77453.1 MAG: hypothetical protein DRR16_29655 [Gammaproteobacteria bacterium]
MNDEFIVFLDHYGKRATTRDCPYMPPMPKGQPQRIASTIMIERLNNICGQFQKGNHKGLPLHANLYHQFFSRLNRFYIQNRFAANPERLYHYS